MALADVERMPPGVRNATMDGNQRCISCQRLGRTASGVYYCQDCWIPLCRDCKKIHFNHLKLNRHSIAMVTDTFRTSPNQGPFPELTHVRDIKLGGECYIRGSTFLPSGELVVLDYTNAKLRLFSPDYTRKPVSSLLMPKKNKFDEKRPRPLDCTTVGDDVIAVTADDGNVHVIKVGLSHVMTTLNTFPVASIDGDYVDCLGLAYNAMEDCIYVGCNSDKEGVIFKVYSMDGTLRRVVSECITEVPEYLAFGPRDLSKIYAADTDSVTAYATKDMRVVERYNDLQAQHRDIVFDKYNNMYVLAAERRTYKSPGGVYRLNSQTGVTKVMPLDKRPASICYYAKGDIVAVTFTKSDTISLYKLALRSFKKEFFVKQQLLL